MGQNTATIGFSILKSEVSNITARIAELKLPARGGVSLYFQMLRELDAKYPLQIYWHRSDGKLHFFPEEPPVQMVAEENLSYQLAKLGKEVLAKKAKKKAAGPGASASK